MKKTMIILAFLILAGTVSYFGGYYFYTTENPKTEIQTPITVQKSVQFNNEQPIPEEASYYFAKVEQEKLLIYKMPDAVVYDSVEMDGLHLQQTEVTLLEEGVRFENLSEVFEFLENAMS